MPGLYKDEGIVLRSIKLGEADRIVTILTRSNGKVRAVAKGIRKTKSRFGGRLEPYTHVALLFYKGRGSLDTITSADILRSFKEVRDDYTKLTGAAALVEAVDKITPDHERAYPTYDLLIGALRALATGKPGVVPAFLVKLLSISGFHPQLQVCSGCGDTRGLDAFSPALGGAICLSCWQDDDSAVRLRADRLQLCARLLTYDFGQRAEPEALADVTLALRRYAEYHLERPLRSLELVVS